MSAESPIQNVAKAVLGKAKYKHIEPDLVTHLAERELAKGRREKEAVKEVTSKLHQIGGAYFKLSPRYADWLKELVELPQDNSYSEVSAFCQRVMAAHSSTAERLPILDDFYKEILSPLAPIDSILDLACGLNPLALPWLPLSPGARYFGCDIFSDLIDFDNAFLRHLSIEAELECADIFNYKFSQPVRLALLLKSLPCLEQLEKGSSADLLDAIPADYLLISYPNQSLGGFAKGMRRTYTAQFEALCEGKKWKVERFEFSSELAFLVEK
jgi:16S rRNA (guanine(1405)-N(7))-methyltransferase